MYNTSYTLYNVISNSLSDAVTRTTCKGTKSNNTTASETKSPALVGQLARHKPMSHKQNVWCAPRGYHSTRPRMRSSRAKKVDGESKRVKCQQHMPSPQPFMYLFAHDMWLLTLTHHITNESNRTNAKEDLM